MHKKELHLFQYKKEVSKSASHLVSMAAESDIPTIYSMQPSQNREPGAALKKKEPLTAWIILTRSAGLNKY